MPENTDKLILGGLLTMLLVAMILLLGINVGSTLIDTTVETDIDAQTGERIESTGSWQQLGTAIGDEESVYSSRGNAINLTGSDDSYFRSTQQLTLSDDGSWTVGVWARADPGVSANESTVLSVNGRLVLTLNHTQSEWRVWYYDESSRYSYRLSASAPDQPASYTNLQVTRNSSQLTLYRNATAVDSQSLTVSNTAASPNASNWDGRIEELRLFDDVLNNSQRSAIVNNPVEPQPDTNRTARSMFDEPYRDQQRLLFASGYLETSNETYSTGFAGRELSADEYRWQQVGPEILLKSGKQASDLPVVYIDYKRSDTGVGGFLIGWRNALELAALLPLLIIIGIIIHVSVQARVSGR